MSKLDASSRWGLLPVAVALGVLLALRLGAIAFHGGRGRERALFGAVAAVAVIVVGVRMMGAFGVLSQDTLFGALFLATGALFFVGRTRRIGVPWHRLVSLETTPTALLATVAVVVIAAAAYLLPVWQYDALGYHLPFVNFALESGSLAGVPEDVPYLSTYPHGVEHFYVAWRAMLPDDRLVDAAQVPFGLLGAAAVACLARQFGARRDHAVAAGLLWMTLPAAFLQMPTNYIDVAVAALLLAASAFALAEPNVRNVLAAGIAIGLFLGSKPNAPIGSVLLFAVVVGRGWASGRRSSLLAAAACVLFIGAESYVVNFIRHGNPIWPVRLELGPFSFPGNLALHDVVESGPGAATLQGPLLLRLLRSWTAIDAPPAFDMRYGGLGLVFLAALPFAVVVAIRRRSVALLAVVAATLAAPDPSVARYILAFPGVVLALGAVRVGALGDRARYAVFGVLATVAAFGLVRAYPGLTGEGPALTAYTTMTESERLRAVGADRSQARFSDVLARLEPKESTAYDGSFDLPYLAWPPDLSRRVQRIPDGVGPAEAARIVEDPLVGVLVVDTSSPVAAAARKKEGGFTELFHCATSSCVVFERL